MIEKKVGLSQQTQQATGKPWYETQLIELLLNSLDICQLLFMPKIMAHTLPSLQTERQK